jgi:hypothetical protein
MGEWNFSFSYLDFGTRRRWVVSFTPRALYPPRKAPRYPMIKVLVGPRAGLDTVEKRKRLSSQRIEPRPFGSWPFAIQTELSRPPTIKKIINSKDSAVGIATGYRLVDWGVRVRVLLGPRIFSSPRHRDRHWGSPSLLSNGYRGLSPRR